MPACQKTCMALKFIYVIYNCIFCWWRSMFWKYIDVFFCTRSFIKQVNILFTLWKADMKYFFLYFNFFKSYSKVSIHSCTIKILTCWTLLISVSTPATSNHGNACTLNVDCTYSMSECVSGVCSCMAGYSFDGSTNSCILGKLQYYIMTIWNWNVCTIKSKTRELTSAT